MKTYSFNGILLTLFSFATSVSIWAQSNDFSGYAQSFEKYRQNLLNDYDEYRNSLLDAYDGFLEKAWGEFQGKQAEPRYKSPKPTVQPKAPYQQAMAQETENSVIFDTEYVEASKHIFSQDTESRNGNISENTAYIIRTTPSESLIEFPYRGMTLEIGPVNIKMPGSLYNSSDFASAWKALRKAKTESQADYFIELAQRYKLNDWLLFDVVRSFVSNQYPKSHPAAQAVVIHYLMVSMGYDVRLALDARKQPVLMLPFDTQVYGRIYMTTNSRNYYIFPIQGDDPSLIPSGSITTCKIPSDIEPGRSLSLEINELALPFSPYKFEIEYDGLKICGELNENLIAVLHRYPQMPTQGFASSVISPDLRKNIVSQVRSQLSSLTKTEAIEKLLHFTQSAFEYATDEEFHGFEKPYFVEEMFYYPKCDCEDRSIFYTWLLWNSLDVPNHLIAYPLHESAAVALEDNQEGDSYLYEGQRYFISDPTYIGARVGQCMPSFKSTVPLIDFEYK